MTNDVLADDGFVSDYIATKALAESFEGMMNPLSIALFEAFLRHQRAMGIGGNGIEFGVYRGRSASIFLKHMQPDERMMLVDVSDKYPEFDKLRAINPDFQFVHGKSEALVSDPRVVDFISPGIRFSHHDASHSYVNVAAEMKLMEHHIMPRGLMVLDDFGNPQYMQVVAACYAHLAQEGCPLETLLYANNKAYLCRKEDFDFYAHFVVVELLPLLHAAGHNVYLGRTDDDSRYRGFSITPKPRPDYPDLYGLHIYGDRYYRVSPPAQR